MELHKVPHFLADQTATTLAHLTSNTVPEKQLHLSAKSVFTPRPDALRAVQQCF
jgi:hypothetical protein